MFANPASWVYLAFVLSFPWILPAAVYVCLRALLVTPNGGLDWLCLTLCFAGFAFCMGHFVWTVRQKRRLAVVGMVRKPSAWSLFGAVIAVYLAMAPSGALTMWAFMQENVMRPAGKGKTTVVTPQEQLRLTLKAIERKGIFTWFGKRDE